MDPCNSFPTSSPLHMGRPRRVYTDTVFCFSCANNSTQSKMTPKNIGPPWSLVPPFVGQEETVRYFRYLGAKMASQGVNTQNYLIN